MKLMTLTYRTYIAAMLLLLGLSACSSKEDIPQPEPLPEQTDMSIRWKVKSNESVESKALVDNDVLQGTCTPSEGGTCESIGVWGQYVIEEDGQTSTHVEFDAVPLTYAAKTEDTNPYNDWNYPGEARRWVSGGVYTFRACYPQALMESLMTEITPTILQGTVNTAEIQKDLLVASAYVDTNTANLSGPVPLDLKHILAAIRIRVEAEDGYDPGDDAITSCWFQNQSDATNLFATSGYLVYSGNETSTMVWYPYESNVAPMYEWEHPTGLSFTEGGETYLYTNNADNAYTTNDGWLLVVPQQVKSNSLHLCYTLKNAPGKVFSRAIPEVTYQAGYKYSYALSIGGADATLTLTIAPWNELDSSYNIDL